MIKGFCLGINRKGDREVKDPSRSPRFWRTRLTNYIVKSLSPLMIFCRIFKVFSTGACMMSEVL